MYDDEPTGYNIAIEDEHYSAGMRDYVAVPVTDGQHFTLFTDDGDLVCEATRRDGGGYQVDGDDDTYYNDWRDALIDGAKTSNYAGDLDAIKRTVSER